jgi:hypothetical protein
MKSDFTAEKVAGVYLVSLVALSVIAGYYFPMWLWGVSLVGKYSWPIVLAFVLVSLAGFWPSFSRGIDLFLERYSRKNFSGFNNFHILIIASTASLIPLLFIIRCPLMGDGVGHIYRAYPFFAFHVLMKGHSPFISAIAGALHNVLQFFLGSGFSIKTAIGERSFLVWSVIGSVSAFVFVFSLVKISLMTANRPWSSVLLLITVLSSGSMALYTGFIEMTIIYGAVLLVYLWFALQSLEKDKFPWLIFFLFFLHIGLHASAVALIPSLGYLLFCHRKIILKKPWRIAVIFTIPAILFYFFLSKLVNPGEWISQFVAGKDVMSFGPGSEGNFSYKLFSWTHVLELLNVLLLQGPLNLLWVAWIIYSVVFRWRRWINDHSAVLLLLLTGSHAGMLAVFQAQLGVLRDWDIYTPLGFLLPITAWWMWEVTEKRKGIIRLVRIIAFLLPFTVFGSALWVHTLHSQERLIPMLFDYSREERYMSQFGKENLASNISIFCLENRYFPDYLLKMIGEDEKWRKFFISRLGDNAEYYNYVLELAAKWVDKLSPLDCANISNVCFSKKKYDECIYYARLSTNKTMIAEGKVVVTAAITLADYYYHATCPTLTTYYHLLLPDEDLKQLNPSLYQQKKLWEKQGTVADSLIKLTIIAGQHVFNNGIVLFSRGVLNSAEQEFIAAGLLGFERERINRLLSEIRKSKNMLSEKSK